MRLEAPSLPGWQASTNYNMQLETGTTRNTKPLVISLILILAVFPPVWGFSNMLLILAGGTANTVVGGYFVVVIC